MEVLPIEALSDNYMYLLINTKSKMAAAVDPVEPDKIVAEAARLGVRISIVLTTHHHFDHAGGNNGMRELLPEVEVIGGESGIQAMTRQVQGGEILPLGDGGAQAHGLHSLNDSHA